MKKKELTQKEFAALGGKALLKKYGRDHFVAMGNKSGGRPKKLPSKEEIDEVAFQALKKKLTQ